MFIFFLRITCWVVYDYIYYKKVLNFSGKMSKLIYVLLQTCYQAFKQVWHEGLNFSMYLKLDLYKYYVFIICLQPQHFFQQYCLIEWDDYFGLPAGLGPICTVILILCEEQRPPCLRFIPDLVPSEVAVVINQLISKVIIPSSYDHKILIAVSATQILVYQSKILMPCRVTGSLFQEFLEKIYLMQVV